MQHRSVFFRYCFFQKRDWGKATFYHSILNSRKIIYKLIDLIVQLPEIFLDSLDGIRGFNKEAFKKVHSSGEQVTSIRVNPKKWSMVNGQCLPAGQAGSIGDNRLDSYVPLAKAEVIHHSPLPDGALAKAGLTIDQRVPWT